MKLICRLFIPLFFGAPRKSCHFSSSSSYLFFSRRRWSWRSNWLWRIKKLLLFSSVIDSTVESSWSSSSLQVWSRSSKRRPVPPLLSLPLILTISAPIMFSIALYQASTRSLFLSLSCAFWWGKGKFRLCLVAEKISELELGKLMILLGWTERRLFFPKLPKFVYFSSPIPVFG